MEVFHFDNFTSWQRAVDVLMHITLLGLFAAGVTGLLLRRVRRAKYTWPYVCLIVAAGLAFEFFVEGAKECRLSEDEITVVNRYRTDKHIALGDVLAIKLLTNDRDRETPYRYIGINTLMGGRTIVPLVEDPQTLIDFVDHVALKCKPDPSAKLPSIVPRVTPPEQDDRQ